VPARRAEGREAWEDAAGQVVLVVVQAVRVAWAAARAEGAVASSEKAAGEREGVTAAG